jgi:predicted ATP-grasp superfamily ATP-dependent carboligase
LDYPNKPFFLKPAVERGGRGTWKITSTPGDYFSKIKQIREITLIDMSAILNKTNFPPLIAMEYLEGDIYDVDVLQSYFVVRKRLDPYQPNAGNYFENNDSILSLAKQIQDILQMQYLYDLDIMYSSEKGAQLIEVNPRPSGSVVATIEAGLNLFEYLLKMALGFDVPKIDIPYGMTVLPKITFFNTKSEIQLG